MSYTQYNFKRDFFYEAENAIENSNITFITGPKKCGKTVCLRQLADAYENALYINMKYDFDEYLRNHMTLYLVSKAS